MWWVWRERRKAAAAERRAVFICCVHTVIIRAKLSKISVKMQRIIFSESEPDLFRACTVAAAGPLLKHTIFVLKSERLCLDLLKIKSDLFTFWRPMVQHCSCERNTTNLYDFCLLIRAATYFHQRGHRLPVLHEHRIAVGSLRCQVSDLNQPFRVWRKLWA